MRPDFLYVGPDKAGSSWLHEVLLDSPQVYVPDAKGLYFFDRYYARGPSWYLGQFSGAGRQHLAVGEVCQDYLFEPAAASRIAAVLGTPRVMVTLRDPAERAFSSYLHMLRSGWRPGSFLDYLEREAQLLDHGRYATHLAPFLSVLGRERVHVGVFDDLVADPQAFADAVHAWLGVAPRQLSPALLGPALPAGRARLAWASRVASWGAHQLRQRTAGHVVGRVKRLPVVQGALYRPLASDRPELTVEERSAVQSALAPEVAELDRLLGLGLAARWGWPLAQP